MSSGADYSDARLKMGRARTLLEELDYKVYKYLRRKPYLIRRVNDLELESHRMEISLTEKPPTEFGLIIGDLAHNMRSALDYCVSANAIHRGKSANDTSFPFASDGSLLDVELRAAPRKRGDEVVQLIRKLKPYPGGNDALVGLHKLDLRDKHKALLVSAAAGDFRLSYIRRPGTLNLKLQAQSI